MCMSVNDSISEIAFLSRVSHSHLLYLSNPDNSHSLQTQSCFPALNPANQLYSRSLAHKSLCRFTWIYLLLILFNPHKEEIDIDRGSQQVPYSMAMNNVPVGSPHPQPPQKRACVPAAHSSILCSSWAMRLLEPEAAHPPAPFTLQTTTNTDSLKTPRGFHQTANLHTS
ncbi:unnamed protein product [Leuciscus chuanchicus]